MLKWPDTPNTKNSHVDTAPLSSDIRAKTSWAKCLGPNGLSRNGYGFACHTVLYLINCIPIICKNGSGSALEYHIIVCYCKNGSESFLELQNLVGTCFGITKSYLSVLLQSKLAPGLPRAWFCSSLLAASAILKTETKPTIS
jgi:hypothetical protein